MIQPHQIPDNQPKSLIALSNQATHSQQHRPKTHLPVAGVWTSKPEWLRTTPSLA